jgi:hypothetical protein
LGNVRLTNDYLGSSGYISNYTLNTGKPYTDPTLTECSTSRGRQNEPSVAVDPRGTSVIVGSSNDYCGVYNDGSDSHGAPIASGPIWLGYYRSQDSGRTFQSSLVPGYPGDVSPYAALSQARTSSAGDPVLAWDAQGRLFEGSESSGDPAGTKKTFGDVFVATFENPNGSAGSPANDGKQFKRSVVVSHGSSAPNLNGVFNDKTAIEADRAPASPCQGNVYFAYSRFTNRGSNIYLSRSTDHGVTFSQPMLLTQQLNSVQHPEIAVTSNGHVYVTLVADVRQGNGFAQAVAYTKSTDCGQTFGPAQVLTTFEGYAAQDVSGAQPAPKQSGADDPLSADTAAPTGGTARDCGDFSAHCQSNYTFFRHVTSPRSTADQYAAPTDESIYVAYDASIPGTEVPTGTTYGSIQPGTGSQQGVYFTRLDGRTGTHTTPMLVDSTDFTSGTGHQLFPDVSADGGVLHLLWWDTRNDSCYSCARPVGNCANGSVVPALDVFATTSSDGGANFATSTRVTGVTSAPNYEQFSGRTVPFAGDYVWITSLGSFSYGTWTDYRDTVVGSDQREGATDTYDADTGADTGADVLQCRAFDSASQTFSGDTCPRAGGLDQNIYGDGTP